MKTVKRKSMGPHFSMCVQPAFIIGTNNEDGTQTSYFPTIHPNYKIIEIKKESCPAARLIGTTLIVFGVILRRLKRK